MVQIDNTLLNGLRVEYDTPFYLMFPSRYRHNIRNFLAAFSRAGLAKVVAGYSFKTNYVPALCQIAKDEGCFAEVVSEMELDLALKLGFSHIIFNGPIKRDAALVKAIANHAIINLDAEYEVDFLCNYRAQHPDVPLQVGLRLNVHLHDREGHSTVQCGLRHGRFGFPHDILGKCIERLRRAGIRICCVHGHTSSSDRAVLNYRIITEYMLSVCQEFALSDIRYFDIGGGFFGAAPLGLDLSTKPTYDDYARMVADTVASNDWFKQTDPYVVIEPGSSVVSNVFDYCTSVFQLKNIGLKRFAMVDGTVFDVKPTMHSSNLPFSVYAMTALDKDEGHPANTTFDVVGSTCMEKDIILKDVNLPELKKGDILYIRGVGAYTVSLSPTFINFLPPIFSIEDDKVTMVRKRQSLDDVLNIYTL